MATNNIPFSLKFENILVQSNMFVYISSFENFAKNISQKIMIYKNLKILIIQYQAQTCLSRSMVYIYFQNFVNALFT